MISRPPARISQRLIELPIANLKSNEAMCAQGKKSIPFHFYDRFFVADFDIPDIATPPFIAVLRSRPPAQIQQRVLERPASNIGRNKA